MSFLEGLTQCLAQSRHWGNVISFLPSHDKLVHIFSWLKLLWVAALKLKVHLAKSAFGLWYMLAGLFTQLESWWRAILLFEWELWILCPIRFLTGQVYLWGYLRANVHRLLCLFQMNRLVAFHWLAAMAFTERVNSSGNR